jgi:uncharacterized protein
MSSNTEGPITVVVRHRIRRGKEPEFEEWLRGLSKEALRYPGHLGFSIVRPSDARNPEYTVLFRFDNLEHLEEWENSQVRREWIARLAPLAARSYRRERHTGLEVWFTPPVGSLQPERYKLVLVTLLSLYPLVLGAQAFVAPLMGNWPIALRTLVTTFIMVCLMTYVVMPFTTNLFSRWLYGTPDEAAVEAATLDKPVAASPSDLQTRN